MSIWLRNLRGVLGTATTWGLAWFGVSLAFWGTKLFGQGALGLAVGAAAGVGLGGAITATCFAVVAGIAERGRGFAQLTILRIAAWGAMGGTLVGLVLLSEFTVPEWAIGTAVLGSLGACSSVASLAVARRATGGLGERNDARVNPPETKSLRRRKHSAS